MHSEKKSGNGKVNKILSHTSLHRFSHSREFESFSRFHYLIVLWSLVFVDFFKKEKTSFHHKWNGTRFIITRKWMYELPHELPNDVRRKDPIKLRDFKKITWYSWNRRGMPSGTPLSIPWQLSFSHITKKWPAKHSIEKQNFNFTKRSNTFKQFVGNLPTNCLSVFDHFVRLALKGLIILVNLSAVSCLRLPSFLCMVNGHTCSNEEQE